jgi:hypothetical protein
MKRIVLIAGWLGIVCAGLVSAAPASAAAVSLLDASYTVGSLTGPQTTSFQVSGAGTMDITVTDIPWPQALAGISVELTNAQGKDLGRLDQFGSQSFSILGPGTYYLFAYASVNRLPGSSYGFGSYGLDVSFTASAPPPPPVPLPQAALLLLSGLALLAAIRREPTAIRM